MSSPMATPKRNSQVWLKRNGLWKCTKCKACERGANLQEFDLLNGQKRKIEGHITCETDFVVYLLRCNCGMKYIGTTTNKLKLRILQHWRAIRNQDFSYSVAKHIWECHDGGFRNISYSGIKRVQNSEGR